jgi:predicted RecA/RadA family phage recombinase
MAGLTTYNSAYRQQSADVGFAILQAGKQSYLTDALVASATSGQDLIDDVMAAVVSPGAESFSQRNSIARAIQEGINLGDLSSSRVQAATSVSDLAQTYTWVDQFPNSANGQLGPNLLP